MIDPEELKRRIRLNLKCYTPLFIAQLKEPLEWRKASLRRLDRLIYLDTKQLSIHGIKLNKL